MLRSKQIQIELLFCCELSSFKPSSFVIRNWHIIEALKLPSKLILKFESRFVLKFESSDEGLKLLIQIGWNWFKPLNLTIFVGSDRSSLHYDAPVMVPTFITLSIVFNPNHSTCNSGQLTQQTKKVSKKISLSLQKMWQYTYFIFWNDSTAHDCTKKDDKTCQTAPTSQGVVSLFLL